VVDAIENRSNPRDPEAEAGSVRGIQSRSIGLLARRSLAEEEGYHPDLQLEGYRKLKIVLWTHAVGGLTEKDFILAAKINQLPIQLRY
jgi:hypothetical protein